VDVAVLGGASCAGLVVYPVSWTWRHRVVVVVARCCCHCCGYSHGAIKFVGLPELQLADIVWLPALSVVIIVTG
jgi:hypothetical protein